MTKTLKSFAYDLTAAGDCERAIARLRQLESRLPSARARFAIPFVFRGRGHFKSLEPRQNPVEFEQLYAAVCDLRPRRVLELGTGRGGALYLWCQAAADDAMILSVDVPGNHGGGFTAGYAAPRAGLYQAFSRPGQSLALLRADSHSPATLALITEKFRQAPADFAYVDKDHTFDGVHADFLQYGPLVRPGGLIAFHDILPRDDMPGMQVHRFWDQLERQFPGATTRFVGPDGSGRRIGIGLLRVPPEGCNGRQSG